MILAIDFRTDIPAFYSKWVLNRFKEGFLYFRNPSYPNTLHKVIYVKKILKYYILGQRKCPNCGTWCEEELLNNYYCKKNAKECLLYKTVRPLRKLY